MPVIGEYNVSSCNARVSQGYPAAIRVKRNGVILAEVFPGHSNPLVWVQRHPHSEHYKEIVSQLQALDVPEEDIREILTLRQDVK